MKIMKLLLATFVSAIFFLCSSCGINVSVKNDENGKTTITVDVNPDGSGTQTGGKDFVEGVTGVLSVSGSDVVYPESLWSAPDYSYAQSLDFGGADKEGVKGIFFTSPIKYNGKPTRVAAYIGFPEGASAQNKVPAIVLVHGGLGTAIPQWVKYWNDLGFAAISMDTEGGEPTNGISNENTTYHLERNRYAGGASYEAGPTNNSYNDWDKPLEDQWMYHATASVILSTSLISSFDCVDTNNVGITGISWGSVITSIILKYDYRLSFAMPVYGGVTQSQSSGSSSTRHPNETSINRWDTIDALIGTKCKTFYVTGDADPAFSMDIADRCSSATNGSLTYVNGLTHGQSQGAYQENLPNFAKYCCGMGAPFVKVTSNPTRENPRITVEAYNNAKIEQVWLYYTDNELVNNTATWLVGFVSDTHASEYTFTVPETMPATGAEVKHAYVRIRFDNNKTVCSNLF